jgi:uncharacterized membrane protein YbhN (UPF0104 family)
MTLPAGWWRIAVCLVLLLALVLMLDVSQILAALQRMDWRWTLAAAGLMLSATMLGAWALHLLFNTERTLPFLVFLPVYWTAWAVGLVFPGQVGDMASLTVMLQRHGLPPALILGRSMADKLVSLLLMIGLALWALRQRLSAPLFAAIICGAVVAAVLLQWLLRTKGPLARHRITIFIHKTLSEALLVWQRYPVRIACNALLTIIKICFIGLAYWVMFRAFGFHQAPAWDVITLVAVSSLVAYIPISFNGIGTAEVAGVALFAGVGVAPPAVLASYLVLRAIGLTLAWIPAGTWLLLARRHR